LFREYLTRIGLASAPAGGPDGIDRLQKAHTSAIAFENLDIQLGRPIRTDSASVFEKLVRRGRGGYCFEHNRLYCDFLRSLGMNVRPLLARGLLNLEPGQIEPRNHLCLLAQIDGQPWLLDVGFGALYVAPMPLAEENVSKTGHRLRRIGTPGSMLGEWLLERNAAMPGSADSDWQRQYSFDLAEVADEDIEQASHWTSTREGTRFTDGHVVSMSLKDGFAALTDRQLSVYRASGRDVRDIEDAKTYAETLRDLFKLNVSDEEASRLPLFVEE